MKTKEQIKNWLNDQPWKNEFLENFVDGEDFRNGIAKFGVPWGYNETFIRKAFNYNDTKQGVCVWMDRARAFQEWYTSENDRPQSWEEFTLSKDFDKNIHILVGAVPAYLEDAVNAYLRLIRLRNKWISEEYDKCVHRITVQGKEEEPTGGENPYRIIVHHCSEKAYGLSFPTDEMAQAFIKCFSPLIYKARFVL